MNSYADQMPNKTEKIDNELQYYTQDELEGLKNYLINRKALPKRINDFKYYPNMVKNYNKRTMEYEYLTTDEM